MRVCSFEGPADVKVPKGREGELIRRAERFWLEKVETKMLEPPPGCESTVGSLPLH